MRRISEELGEGKENDQNISYEKITLKMTAMRLGHCVLVFGEFPSLILNAAL